MPATDLLLDLPGIARAAFADPAEWRPAVRYDEEGRWYTRLRVADDHEVWLLSWLPGQGTGIHDHGGSAGAFLVASGSLREHTFDAYGAETVRDLSIGDIRPFDARHVHEVHNIGDEPAVSLHVYGPALRVMNRYEVVGGRLVKRSTEKAGVNW
jgi:mannose-6-phosphate isomerase-like protein (cupin superfamily)